MHLTYSLDFKSSQFIASHANILASNPKIEVLAPTPQNNSSLNRTEKRFPPIPETKYKAVNR